MTSTPVTPASPQASPLAPKVRKPIAPWPRRIPAAIVAGIVVGVVTHVVAVLAFFVGNGLQNAALPPASNFYALSSVFVFVLVALLIIFGGFRYWFTAVLGGLVAGVLAALLGSFIAALGGGAAASGAMFTFLLGTLVDINLVFVLTVIVVTATLGRVVYRAVLGSGAARSTGTRRTALIRVPASNLNEGEITHIDRVAVDTELADTQWENYVAALNAEGWETLEVAAAETMADSTFVEDAVVMFAGTAVIANPGAESRQGEIAGVESTVRELGLPVARIEAPGTLDGGDVLKVGSTVYVGRGGRTNAEGIRQLRGLVSPFGFTVVAVPMTKALHLKSAVAALPDGTVIGYPPLVNDPSIFDRFLAVPEESGAHVVVLAPDTVLMAASAPKSVALIEDLGYRVVTVDISEFEKLEGCVTCLSVRIR